MNILRCEHLTKTYGSGSTTVNALNGVDLAIKKGSFVAVVGTSGSGKSTLLHLLGGVDRPTSGHIFIEDTDIASLSEKQMSIFRRRTSCCLCCWTGRNRMKTSLQSWFRRWG